MPRAKVTSKGQITIPAEVREALGVKQGDMLAFEAQADYVVVRRVPTALEVAEQLDAEGPLRLPEGVTDDEAVAAYFDEHRDDGWGPTLYAARTSGGGRK
ncbi:MAG TPA: AbrB/MazE/SpoVT family DNA-binding domain-containing protein [Coriobacteriia bacterium]|nr:AbrB/MazE/SpoVT family DNA-binding domain-containing protein [Coriobacteriia bacterium]